MFVRTRQVFGFRSCLSAAARRPPIRHEGPLRDAWEPADALLFTDRRDSIEHEAGEYRLAVEQGRITHAHVRGELGELLTAKREGRTSDEHLTLFRSLGLAVEDLAAAEYVLAKATESGSGTVVQF